MTNSEARKRMQAQNPPESAASIDASPEPSPSATDPEIGPQAANLPWSVGIVANTIAGPVKLLMTEQQADELRDCLVWLTGDGDV